MQHRPGLIRGWLAVLLCCVMAAGCTPDDSSSATVLGQVDHLVYATPDMDATVNELEHLLGVRAAPGGRHPGWGTRNALIALGEQTYLEILGPDPEQPEAGAASTFKIHELTAPRLITWAAKGTHLERLVEDAQRRGLDLGTVWSGSRRLPDGALLSWRLTDPAAPRADGLVPFFIDWGDAPHPAATAPRGCTLVALRAEHPQPTMVREMLRAVGIDLPVRLGTAPALIATIKTPNTVVELH
jgi:hypothetical protein